MLGVGAKEAEACRIELRKSEERLDQAEVVIAGIESRLSSLAYSAPELRGQKLEELAEVARQLTVKYRNDAVHETAELRLAS